MSKLLTGTMFVVLATTMGAVEAAPDPAVTVGVGRVAVVRTKQAIATLVVGDPTIADVTAEGENAVLVFGKKPGRTDLVLMDKDHRLVRKSSIIVGTAAGGDTIVVRRPQGDAIAEDAWVCAAACAKVKEK